MALIGVDIDSTLYDFSVPFRQAYLDLALEKDNKEEYFKGAYQSWVEWRSPSDVCGLEAFSEALARVHSPEVILKQTPYEHAAETLHECVKQGHTLKFISNRDEDTHDATEEWLVTNGFPDGNLVCTMENKNNYLGSSQYLIDDRPKTLCDFIYNLEWKLDWEIGVRDGIQPRKAFGLLFEYNRALTDIPGIYLAPTWRGLYFYLVKCGVLIDREGMFEVSREQES